MATKGITEILLIAATLLAVLWLIVPWRPGRSWGRRLGRRADPTSYQGVSAAERVERLRGSGPFTSEPGAPKDPGRAEREAQRDGEL